MLIIAGKRLKSGINQIFAYNWTAIKW